MSLTGHGFTVGDIVYVEAGAPWKDAKFRVHNILRVNIELEWVDGAPKGYAPFIRVNHDMVKPWGADGPPKPPLTSLNPSAPEKFVVGQLVTSNSRKLAGKVWVVIAVRANGRVNIAAVGGDSGRYWRVNSASIQLAKAKVVEF